MNEFIEKLIGRLEEAGQYHLELSEANKIDVRESHRHKSFASVYGNAVSIVKELAEEYKGGWISVNDRLPEDGREVLAYCDNGHCSGISVVRFRKGKTKEELQAMEWPCFGSADQWGNNLKPYAWFENGPMEWFGQDVIAWQPLPKKPY